MNLLVAVDGSANADRAVAHVLAQVGKYREPLEVHLLTVQLPQAGPNVKMLVSREDLNAYYREEGMKALEGARSRLDAAGVKHSYHIGVGSPAEVIAQYSVDKRCDQIVMGSRGLGNVSSMVLGSVATQVIRLAEVPVLLVK